MNREIIFRGKSIAKSKWLYGNIQIPEAPYDKYFMWDNGWQTQVDANTIGQYTGLKDKVGKKIFEGDIVEFTNLDLPNMVIRFDNGSFMLCEDKNSTYEELRMNYAVEVVGNIYEHPELIK